MNMPARAALPSAVGATYRIVGELTDAQIDTLVALYKDEWWSKGRAIGDVRKMLRHSDIVFGLVEADSERLVGFARVITDRVYRGTIYDVIVAPELRGSDLGKLLIEAVTSHPELKEIESLELHCLPELEQFYAKWGFTPNSNGTNTLRRQRSRP